MDNSKYSGAVVAACVVLYNSNIQVVKNIDTYVNQVNVTYVLDNSEEVNEEFVLLIKNKPNVEYYWMAGNKGIAVALNQAAQLAIDAKCHYLLMMDDDSHLIEGTLESMLAYIAKTNNSEQIGTVSPQSDPNVQDKSAQHVWYAITSGSLLNLKAYQAVGPFMDELFIDGIDHEYCYRLKRSGYEVIILNYLFMPHRMGTPEEIKIFGRIVYRWSSHSPTRSYYLVRNFLLILKMYKSDLPGRIKLNVYYGVLKACVLDLMFGSKRTVRFRYIGKAIIDFRDGRLGKLSHTFE